MKLKSNQPFWKWIFCLLLPGLLVSACRQEPAGSPNPADDPVSALKILVAADGVYQLTPEDLSNNYFTESDFDPAALKLTMNGEPVPFVIWDDRLIFYGRASDSRYTAERAYILQAGETGMVMDNLDAPTGEGSLVETVPRKLHLEENLIYTSEIPSEFADGPWFWQAVRTNLEVPFTLPAVADGSGVASANLYGTTHHPDVENDHSLSMAVNGQTLGELIWEGQTYHTGDVALPAGTLQTGNNTLTLENIPEDYLDFSNLNWIDIIYNAPASPTNGLLDFSGVQGAVMMREFELEPLIMDIAEPDRPVQMAGWEYAAAGFTLGVTEDMHIVAVTPEGLKTPAAIRPLRQSTLHDPAQQADLLIITTADLAPALADLVAAREAEGLSVVPALVEDIYDGFGHGFESPEAIHNFIRYAAESWSDPDPRYVFLVGDATTDYHGYLANRPDNPLPRPENIVPSPLVAVNFSGETVSDSRLVDIDGDTMPDMAIGRWPVNTPEQVADLVQRTLAYEAGEASSRALFTADGSSREFRQLTGRLISSSKFPADEVEILNGASSTEVAESWNNGTWLVTYTGHGSLELWGKEDVFSVAAVSRLDGENAPPIVVQLTCLSGLFAHPEINSLSEVMLTDQHGPVILIGATSLTYSSDQEPFALGLLTGLQNPEMTRIGDVFQAAKQGLDINREGVREVNDTFVLFGDPTATVLRP